MARVAARRRLLPLLPLLLGMLGASATAADAQRGRALYEGRAPFAAQGATMPPCANCHRPSGMGNFEGGLAVPPIAGPTLFKPLDGDTARYFAASSRLRVRPAYDEASLGRLLRRGESPDGVTMAPAMPRYGLDDADLSDLTAYLRSLSDTLPPGIDADTVRVATITTPDADPVRRDAMLDTLRRFVEQKNSQSRHDAQRSAQSARTREMVMYRKFRVWQLEHWALQGEPATWAGQLEERQSRQPVYAVVAGMGSADWSPVDAFCERRRLPCLLPLVDAGAGAEPGFYSLHYHAGIDAEAATLARRLKAQGMVRVSMWSDRPTLAERVRGVLVREGLDVADRGGSAIVSLLAPEAHSARLRERQKNALPVAWLPGMHALGRKQLEAALPLTGRGWIVTPMRSGELLDRQLLRTRMWLRGQRLDALPVDVAASTLQAATVLGEGLMHLDFGFTQEYLMELLEHGLENVIPWSPFARLSIGPDQRIASKGSWVGEVLEGRVEWQWTPQP